MRVCEGFATRKPILSSKPLISLVFFLLNLSSMCHGAALMRVGGPSGVTSAQSYPQLLWVASYDAGVSIAANWGPSQPTFAEKERREPRP